MEFDEIEMLKYRKIVVLMKFRKLFIKNIINEGVITLLEFHDIQLIIQ